MRAIEAMFVWTPDNQIWAASPLKGHIAVTTIPEAPELKEHPKSTGACDVDWREASDDERKQIVQDLILQWIYRENIPEARVRAVVTQIDEYVAFPFSTKMA